MFHSPGKGFAQSPPLIHKIGETEALLHFLGSRIPVETVGMGKEIAKFLDRQIIVDRWEVRHVSDDPAGFLGLVKDGNSIDEDFSVGWLDEGGNCLDGGGFAGAVGSDQSVHRAFPHLEAQGVHGNVVTVVNLQILAFNHGEGAVSGVIHSARNPSKGQLFLA